MLMCNRLAQFIGPALLLLLVNIIVLVCIICSRCMCTWGLDSCFSQKCLSFVFYLSC